MRDAHAPRPVERPRAERMVQVDKVGVLTWGPTKLTVVEEPADVGRVVCIASGGRMAFRRVLGVHGTQLRLRADVAPFEDVWDGEVLGCVRPRPIDRIAALDPERFTRTNWQVAMTFAHVIAARSRLRRRPLRTHRARLLAASEWPRVREFWQKTCGKVLHVEAQPHQHTIGLFDGEHLVGANIHLVFGKSSYSAFTLVDRRYRGTGGGLRMIEHAIDVARAERLDGIYVHINVRNLPSLGAYRRAGFDETGWWTDPADPFAAAERQWRVLELDLTSQPAEHLAAISERSPS